MQRVAAATFRHLSRKGLWSCKFLLHLHLVPVGVAVAVVVFCSAFRKMSKYKSIKFCEKVAAKVSKRITPRATSFLFEMRRYRCRSRSRSRFTVPLWCIFAIGLDGIVHWLWKLSMTQRAEHSLHLSEFTLENKENYRNQGRTIFYRKIARNF